LINPRQMSLEMRYTAALRASGARSLIRSKNAACAPNNEGDLYFFGGRQATTLQMIAHRPPPPRQSSPCSGGGKQKSWRKRKMRLSTGMLVNSDQPVALFGPFVASSARAARRTLLCRSQTPKSETLLQTL
jgi:hypothetical protein